MLTIIAMPILVILELFFLSADSNSQIKLIALLGVSTISYILFSSFLLLRRIDGYMIFMVLSFIFMFGEQLIYLFGIQIEDMWLYRGLLRKESIYETGFLTLYSYLFMHLGYLMSMRMRVKKVLLPDDSSDWRSRKLLMKAGISIAIIVFIPTMYVLIQRIILNIAMGYAEGLNSTTLNGNIGADTFIVILSGMMIPALLAMFIAKKRRAKWPVFFIIVYITLYMLSGSRMNAFCLVCGLLYAYFLLFSKMTKKKFVFIILLGITIAAFFSFVSHSRGSSDTNQEVLSQMIEDNPIILILKEAGFTSCATGVVVEHCPNDKPYLYGKSYLSGLLYMLPNTITGNYYTKVSDVDTEFSDYISNGGGIGSSFIAEGYYNFGWFSLILFLLYGYFWGILCDRIERSVNSCNYPKIFLYIGMLCIVVLYIRSDTRTFFRNLVWTYLPIYLFCKIKQRSSKKKDICMPASIDK